MIYFLLWRYLINPDLTFDPVASLLPGAFPEADGAFDAGTGELHFPLPPMKPRAPCEPRRTYALTPIQDAFACHYEARGNGGYAAHRDGIFSNRCRSRRCRPSGSSASARTFRPAGRMPVPGNRTLAHKYYRLRHRSDTASSRTRVGHETDASDAVPLLPFG